MEDTYVYDVITGAEIIYSTIVLSWLKTISRNLSTFKGNRVAEIREFRPTSEWRHVPSSDNLADIASRRILGSQLESSSLWWNAPTWLLQDEADWPRIPRPCSIKDQNESDHETDFVGASRQLKLSFIPLAQDQLEDLASILENNGMEWKFIPPGTPHFGVCGKQESMGSSIMGSTPLTYEELLTAKIQIESCLNSRPLYPMSGDPNDQQALSPGHFYYYFSLL
ncbi:hypothetical protein LAZ67_9002055 [Cordylochernes scorpioides]|uniref:Uncharacterized protein n=1 Tax=Cordylochernes scorpioides TaxID=51811 RepID=A0ABY6KVI1_9ARAC|nr:hypothetical protein LAZ67_9002055 [Cordylochernes scorpioides]